MFVCESLGFYWPCVFGRSLTIKEAYGSLAVFSFNGKNFHIKCYQR